MLLTITLEAEPGAPYEAAALSHLLRKHPAKVQAFSLPVGQAHVFYPVVSERKTTAALLIEIDPVGLVRSKRFRGDHGALDYYVNDRPFAASSLMSVALAKVFKSAMFDASEVHPELSSVPLPLVIQLPVLSTRGRQGEDLARRLFAPLGWTVHQDVLPLDEQHPGWGESRYSSLHLSGSVRLDHALRQLYVLLPVLDDAKHYWVSEDEAGKLARYGEGWLREHPERELVTLRYLAHQQDLARLADEQLGEARESRTDGGPAQEPTGTPLRVQRAEAVIAALKEHGAQRVVDLGCGPGALLRRLDADRFFTRIVGTDVSAKSLEQAARALGLEERSEAERQRIELLHSSAVYRDERLAGHDALVLMEVIEHVDLTRLAGLEDAVFAGAAPRTVVVTTPNAEFNHLYPKLEAGRLRHEDHRFEFTRAEFGRWAGQVADSRGYRVDYRGIGDEHPQHGHPTQMAIFTRKAA